jgi:predicted nuclease of restriction endonuclease-like (RecB) superfamily
MRQLAQICAETPILQQVVAKLPWGHTITLIEKLKADNERLWYGLQAVQHGWSRAVLQIQIETQLHARQVDAFKVNNFKDRLPELQSDMAQEVPKRSVYF